MKRQPLVVIGVLGLVFALLPKFVASQSDYKRAAFPAVRWVPEVKIAGRWYLLRSIDGVPVERIVTFIKQQENDKWPRRFEEDLVEMLSEMGNAPGENIEVVVIDPETGQEKTFDQVPLTKENREAIIKLRNEARSSPLELPPKALHEALDIFQATLNKRWSYRHANHSDFDAAIATLRQKINDNLASNEFGIELQKIVALGIDGHAAVSGYELPRGSLPFLVEPYGERFVAFKPDRSGFLADGFPFLTKIDGKSVTDWCTAAAPLVPKGSPQYIRRHSLRILRNVDYLRGVMNLPKKDILEVELTDKSETKHTTLTLSVGQSAPAYGIWPRSGSRLLGDRVGYLRLADLDKNVSVPEIKQWMPKFRDTVGLIVDARDNGGGDRDALLLLYSYLATPDDIPRVFTAAAYRLHPAHKDDHLVQRFMYRADAPVWTSDEHRAVTEFAKTFRPQWELPKGQFSEWHYMALKRIDDPDIYHYDKPVIVLLNDKCFSATDIFLAGLKGMNNVTLFGTPSGGGSAFVQEVHLGSTPFRVRIGSMASFQSDGKLFDGNGVQPDVVMGPEPEYYVGGIDKVLEEAIMRVQKK